MLLFKLSNYNNDYKKDDIIEIANDVKNQHQKKGFSLYIYLTWAYLWRWVNFILFFWKKKEHTSKSLRKNKK